MLRACWSRKEKDVDTIDMAEHGFRAVEDVDDGHAEAVDDEVLRGLVRVV
jgi:hypothetical protein